MPRSPPGRTSQNADGPGAVTFGVMVGADGDDAEAEQENGRQLRFRLATIRRLRVWRRGSPAGPEVAGGWKGDRVYRLARQGLQ